MAGVLWHPPARKLRRRVTQNPYHRTPPLSMCVFFFDIELFFILKKCRLLYKKAMAAANFSRDVLEMFYGPIEENQRLMPPIIPNIRGEFKIVRNNFNDWLRVWKMLATRNNKDLFKFFQHKKFIHKRLHE